ncbi:MAG: carbohydrate ABC transporter permease [Arachnia sp.]
MASRGSGTATELVLRDRQICHRRAPRRWGGLLYIAPSFVILLVIAVIPILTSAFLSFTNYDVLSSPTAAGVSNYRALLTDGFFWQALRNTAIFTLVAVPVQTIVAMVLAECLAKMEIEWLSSFVRSVLFVPVVASLVLIGIVWQFMLAPGQGFVNSFLGGFGLDSVNFLGDPDLALYSVALVSVWRNVGYFLVIFYAGVLDIPRERYEAAAVDQAGPVRRFFHITVPGLRPVTSLCVVLSTIWSFQVFDLVYSMTGGGPGGATTTLVMAIYSAGFESYRMGYASAIAMVLLVVVIVISVVQRTFMKEEA